MSRPSIPQQVSPSADPVRSSLELLLSISRELAATLDLHTLLSRLLLLSVQHLEAERASIIVLDEEQNPVDAAIYANHHLFSHTTEQLRGTITQGLAGWVLRSGHAALINDTSQDERWQRREDDRAERSGAKSALCAPLKTQDGVSGVLTIVHPHPGYFTEDQLNLLQGIAGLAGLAVRNAQLYRTAQTAQQRYLDLFEDSIDPIALTDSQGVILEANQQLSAFVGQPDEALRGRNIMELHPVDWEQVGADFSRLTSVQAVTYEATVQSEQNQLRPVQVYVRKITAGQAEYLQWILRDISERKELDKLRDDLSAMIYHDLRSPLANIVSSLEILHSLLPPSDDPTMDTVFQIAQRSTERLQRLINSLLDLNRLEAGQPLANPKLGLPAELAREAAEAVQPLAESKRQTVRLEVPSNLPAVRMDADMIRRVLVNLAENAIKFTPPAGQITMGGASVPGWVELWVQDTGAGIPPEARDLIFEKFSRLQPTGASKGFGLGLAFCRLAVQAHGGTIGVEPAEPNGSRFIFRLPVSETTDSAAG